MQQSCSQPDIIVLCEVWVKESSLNVYFLKDYKLFQCLRQNKIGGGIFVYVKNNKNPILIQSITGEFDKVKLRIAVNHDQFNLLAYYRPPNPSNFKNFLHDVENEISTNNEKTLVIGDLNLDVSKNDRNTLSFIQTLGSYNFVVCNSEPTRESSGSCIDLIISNFVSSHPIVVNSVSTPHDVSDHNIMVSTFPIKRVIKCPTTVTKSYIDYKSLSQKFSSNSQPPNFPDIKSLINAIQDSVRQATITTEFKIKTSSDASPWWDHQTLTTMKHKDRLWRAIRRCKKANKDPPTKLLHEYKNICIRYQKQLRTSKIIYYKQLFSQGEKNDTWKKINRVLGKEARDDVYEIEIQGRRINEPYLIANAMNREFVETPIKLNEKLSHEVTDSINKYRTMKHVGVSMFLNPTTPQEIKTIIDGLNSAKAAGDDRITPKVLKSLSKPLSVNLSNIINDIFTSAKFPKSLKNGIVKPIPKVKASKDPADFRPITILPVLSKVIEIAFHDRLLDFLTTHNVLTSKQYGYGKGSGTEAAVIDHVHEIRRAVDKKKVCGAIYIDISKAYNTISHELLAQKLEIYGIRGLALQLFVEYLSNRTQQVRIQNVLSDPMTINLGAPQGSVLSNLSYVIDTNDFAYLPLKGKICLYVDDIKVFYEASSVDELVTNMKHDTEIMMDILRINRLSINTKKTKVMFFRSPFVKDTYPSEIQIHGQASIKRVETYKYLGKWMDTTVSDEKHIQELCNKLTPISAVLWKLKWFIPRPVLRIIYFAHFQSHLQYLCATWGSATKFHINQLQVIQNRALKSVFDLPWLHPTTSIYSKNAILPIRGIFIKSVVCFITKATRGQVNSSMTLHPKCLPQYSLRRKPSLQEIHFETNFGRKDISWVGVKLYNELPSEITSKNLPELKRRLTEYLTSETVIDKCLNESVWNLLNP